MIIIIQSPEQSSLIAAYSYQDIIQLENHNDMSQPLQIKGSIITFDRYWYKYVKMVENKERNKPSRNCVAALAICASPAWNCIVSTSSFHWFVGTVLPFKYSVIKLDQKSRQANSIYIELIIIFMLREICYHIRIRFENYFLSVSKKYQFHKLQRIVIKMMTSNEFPILQWSLVQFAHFVPKCSISRYLFR